MTVCLPDEEGEAKSNTFNAAREAAEPVLRQVPMTPMPVLTTLLDPCSLGSLGCNLCAVFPGLSTHTRSGEWTPRCLSCPPHLA